MIQADVAIIGAGPSGTATAIHLGHLGVPNVVLLDRLDFPRDKTCGSAVSPKGLGVLKALGVWEEVEPHSYGIRGLRLVTSGGRDVVVSGGDRAAAIVCCRRTLDHLLLKRAVSLGVRFVPHFYAQELIEEDSRITGIHALDGREVRARFTIVADGAHSRLAINQKPKQIIQAIMGWWENLAFPPNRVEMIFDKAVRPYYGWLFPESDTRVNIGICYEDRDHSKNARKLFAEFLEKHYRTRLAGAVQIGDWKGHQISYTYKIERLWSPGRIITGEAGRMTHPATAEGIYQGMRAGMLAAEALREIILERDGEAEAFTRYESRCREAFQRSFRTARWWRAAVSTPVLDWAVALAQTRAARSAIAKVMAEM